jgi:hypothetical protein
MQYPQHLLPQSHYRLIEWAAWLEDNYLVRHTPDTNLIDTDTEMLRLDYIVPEHGTSQMKDFSTNLLGTFTKEDCLWKMEGDSKAYYLFELWSPGEVVKEPVWQQDFQRDESRGMFFLRIGDIIDQEVPYTIGGKDNFTAVCKVKHTPNRANFWHFSVRWFNQDGDIYPDQRGNWIDRMLKTAIRTVIREHAKLEAPEAQPVLKAYYTEIAEV